MSASVGTTCEIETLIQTLECEGEHASEPLSEACLRAAKLLAAGRAWQSIETAPEWDGKTGPFIDVAWIGVTHRYLPVPRREIGCFCENGVIMQKHGYPSMLTIFDPQPTHWMPPPPAPLAVDADSPAA